MFDGKLSQPSLMFVGKAWAYPSEYPLSCLLKRDKHSGLRAFVNYGRKRFHNPGANDIKLYLSVIYQFSYYARVFVCNKLFQPSLMLQVKPRAYPRVEHLTESCFTRVGSCLAHKHFTRLEKHVTDKHSSLSRKSVNYGQRKFILQEPVQ